jgi:alkylation response protein AidB-like acyl-CoA dehydrogenase
MSVRLSEPVSADPERDAILETVRRFTEEHIVPVTAELDGLADPMACFSWEIIEAADAIGLRTMPLAEEYGGIGADNLTTTMAVETLANADQGVATTLMQNYKLIRFLQKAGTQEQQQRFFAKIADDPHFLMAIGSSEPVRASDYIIPFDSPDTRYQTKAERVDGGWRISGGKHFISNGPVASLYFLFAQTNPNEGVMLGSTCFLIERDSPGFTIGRVHDKMGERLTTNAELNFTDCFVPDENILGEVDRGHQARALFSLGSSVHAAALVLGVAATAYERAIEWTRDRVQGGKPIIEHSVVAVDIAEMRMMLDAARAYVYQAARAADGELTWDPTYTALPKVFAAQTAWHIVTKALELHGGYGYMREAGIEKLVRDAAAFWHSDGANKSLLLRAAKTIHGST